MHFKDVYGVCEELRENKMMHVRRCYFYLFLIHARGVLRRN